MAMVIEVEKKRQIADLAQQALNHHQPRKYHIAVDQDAILEEDGWFHILVTTPGDIRDRDFYDALAAAEAELQDDNGHQYLLVPALGE